MTPARGLVLLRHIETSETLPQGKVILTPSTRDTLTAGQMEVVAIGYPARCETFPDCERPHLAALGAPVGKFPLEPHFHPAGIHAGDWVLVRHRSLTGTHEDGLFCCAQDDILARLEVSA